MIYGFRYTKEHYPTINTYLLRAGIEADIGIMQYIKQVTPTLDANMFIIYGSVNGVDIADLTVKDLTELASLHQKQIYAFVANRVRAKMFSIINRWRNTFEKLNLIASLPEPMYKQFVSASKNIKTITYKFNNINTEAIVAVLQSIRNDFIISASTYSSILMERIPIEPELIDSFFQFLLDVVYQNVHGQMSDPKQYWILNKDITNICIPYLNMLTNGISYNPRFTMYDDPDAICSELFFNRFREFSPQIKEYIRKCRALDLCHVICLDSKWIDGIVLPKSPIIRDNASSKLASLLMVSGTTDENIAKCLRSTNREQPIPVSEG